MRASEHSNFEVVKYIIDSTGANVEAKDTHGRTCLMVACTALVEAIQLQTEMMGQLHAATSSHDIENRLAKIVCYLVEDGGANINAVDHVRS